ncbi:mitochondrial ribosome-associated GTPase 2 [Paroedura picta]|uniref:mitochondrial ribosome-associated GTPase 2 n=1 Tax=Paroedura picta TaxID=143630 RepID=UPI00405608CC
MLQAKILGTWLGRRWRPTYAYMLRCLLPKQSWHQDVSTSCAKCSKSRRLGHKKNVSEKKLTRYFVDHRKVRVTGGKGGDGMSCFLSEPRKEFGGPDGGDGGNGGHIILKVDQQTKSLSSVLPIYRGFDGQRGGSKNCFGSAGKCIYIKVPIGTVVKEDSKVVADLNQHGEEYVAVYGGAGGKGNRFFLDNFTRAPVTATEGELGQERVLHLELKTMAHAGMVGFPNAGKSSLLRAISNAKPAVAAYPFTTLNPHVGIVHYENYEQIAVADIPGVIKGAHLNRGLGIAFLRHVERCRFLLYVLDLSVPEPWTQLQDLKHELEQYEAGLSKRPHAIVGNKLDLPQSKTNLSLLRERVPHRVIPLSALTGDNLEELISHLKELYDDYVKAEEMSKQKPLKW